MKMKGIRRKSNIQPKVSKVLQKKAIILWNLTVFLQVPIETIIQAF